MADGHYVMGDDGNWEFESSSDLMSRIESGFSDPGSAWYGGSGSGGSYSFTGTRTSPDYSYSRPSTTYGDIDATVSGMGGTPYGSTTPRTTARSSRSLPSSSGGTTATSSSGSNLSGSTTTQTWTPAGGDRPTYKAGKFKAPEWEDRKVSSYQQKFAAPAIRRLRDQVRKAQNQPYDNPNVKRMVLRDALQGYGVGLDSALSGAFGRATSAYASEYNRALQAKQLNFQAKETAKQANFKAALETWLKQGTTTQSTKNKYTPTAGETERVEGADGKYAPDGTWMPTTRSRGRTVYL